jgi:RNA polymerase sigma-70 factor (ECF subfamily)
MMLERLTPDERAAFLLHEVFDTDYSDVARILGKTEAACRQLVHRAKERVKAGKPRFTPSRAEQEKVMAGFRRAVESGDVAGLAALFSRDATLYSDGGGKATATINPIFGAEKIARFFIGVRDKQPEGHEIVPQIVNGSLGHVVYVGKRAIQASHFEFDGDRIVEVHIVRNPDKLEHLTRT